MGLVPDPNKFDLIWLPVDVKYSTRDLICDDINYCVLEWRRKNLYHWPVSMRFFDDLVVAYFLCHLYVGLPFLNAVLCARYNKQKQSKTAMCILVTVDVLSLTFSVTRSSSLVRHFKRVFRRRFHSLFSIRETSLMYGDNFTLVFVVFFFKNARSVCSTNVRQ